MRLPAILLLLAFLTGCENPSPRALRRAPVPVPVTAVQAAQELAVVTAPSPIQWDAERSIFVAHGLPLRAEKVWTFDGATDGFVVTNGQGTPSAGSGLAVSETGPDVMVRTPKGLGINGRARSLVIVRITRTRAGRPWDGTVYYSTAAHGEDQHYFAKPVMGGDPGVNETRLLIYDMHRLNAGADDWKTSVIYQFRIDLDDAAGGAFIIEQVAVAKDPGALFDTDSAPPRHPLN